jgi:hypothetical protein
MIRSGHITEPISGDVLYMGLHKVSSQEVNG